MYSRGYTEDSSEAIKCQSVKIPVGYDGNAVFEDKPHECRKEEECESCEAKEKNNERIQKGGFLGDIISKFTSGRTFSPTSILSHIGTEEILLIALSIFLLFSEHGDKECAAMLFLLLFVH